MAFEPAYSWIQGRSSWTIRKYSTSAATFVYGQLAYLTQGRLAEATAGASAKLIGVYAQASKGGASTAGVMSQVWDDPFIIYKAPLDMTYYTDATAAGPGVFTDTHALDVGCYGVHSGTTTTASKGLVYRVSAISTSATFTLTEPDGAGTATIASGDLCYGIPRIGGICGDDATVSLIDSSPANDNGDLLCVNYSDQLRKAYEGYNTRVDIDVTAPWAYIFISLAHVHTAIAGGESAA
jgi:hypothetical protein